MKDYYNYYNALLVLSAMRLNRKLSFVMHSVLKRMLFSRNADVMCLCHKIQCGEIEDMLLNSKKNDRVYRQIAHVVLEELSFMSSTLFEKFDADFVQTVAARSSIDDGTTSYIYGEIELQEFAQVLQEVITHRGEVRQRKFVDLGHGIGKAMVAAALVADFEIIQGIEISAGLFDVSVIVVERCKNIISKECERLPTFLLERGSFLEPNIVCSWRDADVVFANSTCFSEDLINELSYLAASELAVGCRIITFTLPLVGTCFKILSKQCRKMSWGFTTVFIQEKIAVEEGLESPERADGAGKDDSSCFPDSISTVSFGADGSVTTKGTWGNLSVNSVALSGLTEKSKRRKRPSKRLNPREAFESTWATSSNTKALATSQQDVVLSNELDSLVASIEMDGSSLLQDTVDLDLEEELTLQTASEAHSGSGSSPTLFSSFGNPRRRRRLISPNDSVQTPLKEELGSITGMITLNSTNSAVSVDTNAAVIARLALEEDIDDGDGDEDMDDVEADDEREDADPFQDENDLQQVSGQDSPVFAERRQSRTGAEINLPTDVSLSSSLPSHSSDDNHIESSDNSVSTMSSVDGRNYRRF